MKPADQLCFGYFGLTALLAAKNGDWGLVSLHGFVMLAIWASQFLPIGRLWEAVRSFYPIILAPFAYLELDRIRQNPALYDELVMSWETAIFGRSPALWMSELWNWLVLSEFFHACYLSFYVIAPMLWILMFRGGDRRDLERFSLVVSATYFCGFLVNSFFPVLGPRHTFPPLDPSLQGPFWQLVHWCHGQGAAGAAAFPSGHAGLGTIVALSAWRWQRRWIWFFGPVCAGLVLSTIYGRFHYALDTVAGVLLASLVMGILGKPRGQARAVPTLPI